MDLPFDPQTVRTLNFCRALLTLTIRENDAAMASVSGAFEDATRLVRDLETGVGTTPNAPAVRVSRQRLGESLDDALRAVQLHDITDQRLGHVKLLLDSLTQGRDQAIDAVLTDAGERALLELIDAGRTPEEACARLDAGDPARGSVELF